MFQLAPDGGLPDDEEEEEEDDPADEVGHQVHGDTAILVPWINK